MPAAALPSGMHCCARLGCAVAARREGGRAASRLSERAAAAAAAAKPTRHPQHRLLRASPLGLDLAPLLSAARFAARSLTASSQDQHEQDGSAHGAGQGGRAQRGQQTTREGGGARSPVTSSYRSTAGTGRPAPTQTQTRRRWAAMQPAMVRRPARPSLLLPAAPSRLPLAACSIAAEGL